MEEEIRHRCEVREWMKRRALMPPDQGRFWLRGVLMDIERKRGKVAAQRLTDDIVFQWKAGNRGEPNDWR